MTQDFFATASLRGRRHRHLRARPAALPGRRDGHSLHLRRSRAAPGVKPDNAAVREALRKQAAAGAVRLVQRAHVCGRARRPLRCIIPASFPGRDHPPRHRHAVHGLRRRHLHRSGILQRAVRRAVPHPAARHRPRPGRRRRRRAPATGTPRRGTTTRRRCSTSMSRREPFLVRISAAKRLRDRVERDARQARRGPRHAPRASRTLDCCTAPA